MSMSTGAKVAIGCGIVAVLGMGAIAVTLGLGAYWLKGRADEMTGGLDNLARKAREIERWQKEADAHAFTRPADGVVTEESFARFMDVRRQVYATYEGHAAELEGLAARAKEEKDVSVSEALAGAGALARLGTDVRLALVKALAEVGMSQDEYAFVQAAIYQSAWASAVEQSTGQRPAEALGELMESMPAEAGAETAAAVDEIARAADEVPPANVALFRRHEDEIRKYAMSGLSFLGL